MLIFLSYTQVVQILFNDKFTAKLIFPQKVGELVPKHLYIFW